MAAAVLRAGGGSIAKVFKRGKELEGAYDFVENDKFDAKSLVQAPAVACAKRCAQFPFVWVLHDGTSLTYTDRAGTKDFGSVGTVSQGARGIKVITALVLDPTGVPVGLGVFEWWVRQTQAPGLVAETEPDTAKVQSTAARPGKGKGKGKKVPNGKRKVQEKETQRWINSIRATRAVLASCAPDTKRWVVMDREADSWTLLHEACRDDDWMTIRSKTNRRLRVADDSEHNSRYLRDALAEQPVLDEFRLHVPPNHGRKERTADMAVSVCRVTLDMKENWSKKTHPLTVNALWVREVGTVPESEKPLDWVLFTNHATDSLEDVHLVVYSYAMRWRIEDFHKTWKSAGARVEDCQLQSTPHLIKWATILAVTAARVERLKHFAREQPDLPASVELSADEIEALLLLKKREGIRRVPPSKLTIGQASQWIGQLGGHLRRASGRPAGSTALYRGLEYLETVADGVRLHRSKMPAANHLSVHAKRRIQK